MAFLVPLIRPISAPMASRILGKTFLSRIFRAAISTGEKRRKRDQGEHILEL